MASGKDKIYIIDALSGELKQELSGHREGIWNILTVKDKLIISSGLDETIRVWDIESGKCIAILAGHIHKIKEMVIDNNNKHLITLDRLGKIILWEADWENL